eukprot:6693140-Alexandrium_andersonii.AAC.1
MRQHAVPGWLMPVPRTVCWPSQVSKVKTRLEHSAFSKATAVDAVGGLSLRGVQQWQLVRAEDGW